MAGSIYSVAQVNSYIKNLFVQDFLLNRISVRGEVSNCKYHTSGHIYFTLKDKSGTLSAVMFAGQRKGLTFQLQEGQQVVVTGSIDIYERDGRYQLYAREIKRDGVGDLFERFQKQAGRAKPMKQRFKTGVGAFVLCVVLLLAGALPVCAVKAHPIPDSGMTLDTSELLLELTSEDPAPVAYLTVQAPNDYFFLIWTSSAPSVASVDGTGKVTGHSEGTASITACNERGEKTACLVTVRKSTAARPVLNTTELALTITEQEPAPSAQLKLEQNDRGFIYVRQWVSSSPSVAQVSSSGTVTGQSSGRAVISALTTAGQVLRCTVTVTSEIGRVRISKNAMLLQAVGASQKLTAQAAGGKNTAMTWLSSNPDVAQVNTDGTVTAVGDGETVILAVSPEGRADACYVAVGTAAWRYRSEEELAEVLTVSGQLPYSDGK